VTPPFTGFISEIEHRVLSVKPTIPDGISAAYIGGRQSRLTFHGLKVPVIRKIRKEGFSFSSLPHSAQFKIWTEVWKCSAIYEVKSVALDWIMDRTQLPLVKERWPVLQKWALQVDNWAHADGLCSLYARLLEDEPKLVYPVLQKWNKHPSPWMRRMSIVSLLYYAAQRERVLPVSKILSLVKPLLSENHHYIQKAVGWTLRECHTVFPSPTMSFIRKHVGEISATAFSAVIERMTPKDKKELKADRQSLRLS